jgi:alkaline phosphatase D
MTSLTGLLFSTAVVVAVAASASGATLVSSTFDSGDDAWRAGEFLTTSALTVAPAYFATGGNTGGYLRVPDVAEWGAYHAPAKFLGNKAAAYGGSLSFDLRIQESDPTTYSMVLISDGTTTLQFRSSPALGSWNTFTVDLVASAGWQLSTNGKTAGAAVSELQLQTVLSNLQTLRINSDWKTGADQVDLDNVLLSSDSDVAHTPEPSTMGLLGLSLGVVALLRRRRSGRA